MRYDYTFGDVLSKIKERIQPGGNVSTEVENLLKSLINEVHVRTANLLFLRLLRKDAIIMTTATYSTGTVTVANGSTTVAGTDTVWDSTMVGRKIRFSSQTSYYTISAVASATSLTLSAAYTGDALSGDTYTIFTLGYRLPRDYVQGREKTIRYLDENITLKYRPWDDVVGWDPALNDLSSSPAVFTLVPDYEDRDPTSSTLTAEGGSSTTSVVCSSLASSTDDYYNGWILVNTTRGDTSEVTDYVGSTKTLTVSPAITSQAQNDTFYVIDRRLMGAFWPIFTSAKNILFEFFRQPAYLRNAYDLLDIPEEFGGEEVIISYVLKEYYKKDPLGMKYDAQYKEAMVNMRRANNVFLNEMFRKEPYGRVGGGSPDVNIPYEVST